MNAHSEDLREKIVEALRRGMGKSQAARTFSVSLSSVKRYAKLAEEGRSLAPKNRPGSKPKIDERASKLLEEDLKERPFLTLQKRCEYLRVVAGLEVSRSTMCRAIRRMDSSRKKGEISHRTRRVHEGCLEGSGSRGGGPHQAGVRR
jgi:transposase